MHEGGTVAEVNLLQSLPRSQRNIAARQEAKDREAVRIAKEFGELFFDGPRKYGYGGYYYDGRWRQVARDIIKHFSLCSGDRVLDIGCAKGFLVKDLMIECPGLEVFGIDISSYALTHCESEVVGRLHLGEAHELPFSDKSFDIVLSINTIHNYDRAGVKMALKEIERTSRRGSFVQVDSYRTAEEKQLFEDWVLTAEFHDYPDGWRQLFQETGYRGDYYWTFVTE